MKKGKGKRLPASVKGRRKIRLAKDFVWRLLRCICEDTREQAISLGLSQDVEIFEQIIRRRSVLDYIEQCDGWALSRLNYRMSDADPSAVSKIRILRLFSCGRKYVFPNSPFKPLKTALSKFREYEQKCSVTNSNPIFWEALSDSESPSLSSFDSTVLWPILQFARGFIGRVLGDTVDVAELLRCSHHGPGASVGCRGKRSIPLGKYLPPLTTTDAAAPLAEQLVRGDQRWMRAFDDSNLDFSIATHETASIQFVPKNAKTLRSIMIEPTGNMSLQLGVDTIIRRGLLRVASIDLSTQEKNQILARRYSISGDGVTIDLSGASDTIALIWLALFPPSWAELLYSLRTPSGVTDFGELFTFEKLSSMGNGYTFAVETLIFSALLYGTIRQQGFSWKDVSADIAVFGDDIILPEKFFWLYRIVLKKMGFIQNSGKSFSKGPIRESCGSDFFRGHEISCFSISPEVKGQDDLYVLHNSLFNVEEKYGLDLTLARMFVVRCLPPHNRNYGPVTEEFSSHLFTRSECALSIYFSRQYHRKMVRYRSLQKIHPKMSEHSKVFGDKAEFFLPLVEFLQRPQKGERDSWLDCHGIFRGPPDRFRFIKEKESEKSVVDSETSTSKQIFHKRRYAFRSSMKSIPWDS